MQVYTHVIPGMDQTAADSVAALILGTRPGVETRGNEADVRDSVRDDAESPLDKELTWTKAQVSEGSGGRI
jgi:hypothetical protein